MHFWFGFVIRLREVPIDSVYDNRMQKLCVVETVLVKLFQFQLSTMFAFYFKYHLMVCVHKFYALVLDASFGPNVTCGESESDFEVVEHTLLKSVTFMFFYPNWLKE